MKKFVRTVCLFTDTLSHEHIEKLNSLASKLEQAGFVIQTKRICVNTKDINVLKSFDDGSLYLSLGTLKSSEVSSILSNFCNAKNINFNIDLTNEEITTEHAQVLFDVIKSNASKTFNFTYVFNNNHSSPYFPSATYQTNGFAVGLQPTDLAEGCGSVQAWLDNCKKVWDEIANLFADNSEFLGIDSSVAPLFQGSSSLVNFIKKIGMTFPQSTTTDTYVTVTKFIKEQNPKPTGLCGLMFPCLEDFELAEEYEKGEFSIERNVYLSLHSGLGIDTYPMGIDEKPERVVEILKLIQALSNKYSKPLSTRFVSDGKAKIGEQTDFKNQYLKDIIVKSL